MYFKICGMDVLDSKALKSNETKIFTVSSETLLPIEDRWLNSFFAFLKKQPCERNWIQKVHFYSKFIN